MDASTSSADSRSWVLLRRGGTVAGIAAVGALLVAWRLPLCPFAIITGHPCPGCGLTRATIAILHGQVGRAFDLQPFAFVASPLLGLALVLSVRSYLLGGAARLPPRFGAALLHVAPVACVAMIAFWVARFFGVWGGPVPV